jgi:hypothetical protein
MEWSESLKETWERARSHGFENLTLEQLLTCLIADPDTQKVLQSCRVDARRLQSDLTDYLADSSPPPRNGNRSADIIPAISVLNVIASAEAVAASEGNNEVNCLDVLSSIFGERQSYAVSLLERYGVSQLQVVGFILSQTRPASSNRTTSELPPKGIQPSWFQPNRARNVEPPPELPTQGIGPHVELDSNGIINFVPPKALDQDGNNVPRLRALQPHLRELAEELAAELGMGNAPHSDLGMRLAAYSRMISGNLEELDFVLLYGLGVRLANAADAAKRAKDLPPLETSQLEKLSSLLDLHGSFIMATKAGAEALLDEERYRRRPAEELRYRSDAIAVARLLQDRPDLIDPVVAEHLLGTAYNIGQGENPERSTVAGRAMVRNVLISVAGGALGSATFFYATPVIIGASAVASFVGMLALSETVKKTKWFKSLTEATASGVDAVMDASSLGAVDKFRSGLRRQKEFVTKNEEAIRRVAGSREGLRFLHRALDWIKQYDQ